ncbi:hypothetical protein D3C73_1307790 [compost metagenome]
MVALRMMASAITAWPLSMAKSGAIGLLLFGSNTKTWEAEIATWLVPSDLAMRPIPAVISPALAFALHMA